MSTLVSAQEIKEIRGKYGLSQKAFARILGIGDASIVRYENGQQPTRAISNLIRAAKRPEFLLECMERCEEDIPFASRVEKIVYAAIQLDGEGNMDINDIYEITLQQEVLTEKAAQVLADLSRLRREAVAENSLEKELVYEDLIDQLWRAKDGILDCETKLELERVAGVIDCLDTAAQDGIRRAA